MNKQIDDAYQRHLNRNGKCYCGHTISCDCGDLSKEEFIEKYKMDIEKYDQLVSDAFKSYLNKTNEYKGDWPDTLEEFINKCKTDPEFSEKWGLKIEERELSLEERATIWNNTHNPVGNIYTHNQYDENDIPTKLITISYNDKTIESYENNS
jgi:hypothetical protein